MAIILPKEGSIYETLGAGLGSGLQALAQGKVQQLQKRNYANSLQQMGLSPEIAYLPENLQQLAIKQSLGQQSANQSFNALASQAQQLGLSDRFLETAKSAGPVAGSEMLKGIIRDLQKPEKAQNLLQTLGITAPTGKSVYRDNGTVSGIEALSKKYGNQNESAQALLQNPEVSSQEKDALRREIAANQAAQEGSYGLIETPLAALSNLISGAVQGIGSLGGATGLINTLLEAPSVEEKMLKRQLSSAQEGTPEYTQTEKRLENLKEREKGIRKLPSSADIKEEVVQPLAKLFGVEKYVNPRNVVENIAERVGKVAPVTLLASLARGGELGMEVLKSLQIPLGAETLGTLTKKFTGSDVADGVATLAGYLLGAYAPDSWNNAISKGYKSFQNNITNVPNARLNAEPLLEDIQPIIDKVNALPGTRGNTFLRKQISALTNAVHSKAPGGLDTLPGQSISAHKAFELDQLLGGDTYRQAAKIGGETASSIQAMREGLRKIWQPYFMEKAPDATNALLSARDAKSALNFTDKIQELLKEVSSSRVPLFYLPAHAVKFAAKLAHPTRKFIKQISTSPALRDITFEVVSQAAQNNAPGIIDALNKLPNPRQG